MARVIVLGGGISSEREVSLRSSQSVIKALNDAGIENSFKDPKFEKNYLIKQPDSIVFPILHGKFGEDGALQKELEENNIPFLGSGSVSSKNCFDKCITLDFLRKAGIKVAKSDYIGREEYPDHELASVPHVLKIPDGGSSIGTYIIRDPKNSQANLETVFEGEKIIIEELIDGVELTVPILDQEALPVIEIQPPIGGEFDYENKYNGKSAELCPPTSIGQAEQKQVQRIAENVHKIMECRHLSRVDFMIDQSGAAYVLEINTIPGLTDQSLFPKSAQQAGINMPELVKRFYDMVVRDYSLK